MSITTNNYLIPPPPLQQIKAAGSVTTKELEDWDADVLTILSGAGGGVDGAAVIATLRDGVATNRDTLNKLSIALDAVGGGIPTTRVVAAAGLATGGGSLAVDRTITVTGAAQAEAEAGVSDAVVMTPLRTKQAVTSQTPIASQAEAEAGIETTKRMTALRTRQAITTAPMPFIYASRYGVVAGTFTDQGPALRAAIAAAEAINATLIMPPGVISIAAGASATELLTITKPMSLVGTGCRGTRLHPIDVGANTVGSRDVITIRPLASTYIRGMRIANFEIGAPGLGPLDDPDLISRLGRDAIRIETLNTNGHMAKLLIENISCGKPVSTMIGYSVNHINTLAANFNGGVFASTFRNNDFWAGIKFELTGDSNNIIENLICGPRIGIDYKAINTGAATHRIEGNNITAWGGAIRAVGSLQVKIVRNQIEQSFAYTGTQNACIVLDATVQGEISENNINGHSRVDAVLLTANTTAVTIRNNVITAGTTTSAKVHVKAVSSPLNSVGVNRYQNFDASYAVVSRVISIDTASHPTRNVFQKIALEAASAWADASDTNFWQGLWIMVDDQNVVRMRGGIVTGTVTGGTVVANLPAAYRPLVNSQRVAGKLNGAPWTLGMMQVLIGGQFSVQSVAAGSVLMHLDDVSYAMDN